MGKPENINDPKKEKAPCQTRGFCIGAGNVTRTHDLLITNQLLYRLSYASIGPGLPDRKRYCSIKENASQPYLLQI